MSNMNMAVSSAASDAPRHWTSWKAILLAGVAALVGGPAVASCLECDMGPFTLPVDVVFHPDSTTLSANGLSVIAEVDGEFVLDDGWSSELVDEDEASESVQAILEPLSESEKDAVWDAILAFDSEDGMLSLEW